MKYVKYGHEKWQPDLRETASKITASKITASKIIEETINAITKSLNRIAEQPTWKDIF
jgi:hypothetical protein